MENFLEITRSFLLLLLTSSTLSKYTHPTESKYKYICSSLTISFEFIEKYRGNDNSESLALRAANTVGELKHTIQTKFGSNCIILLKKKDVQEYLELDNNEPVPPKDIYIKFDKEPEFKSNLKTKLSVDNCRVNLKNLRVHDSHPTSMKKHFEHFTVAREEKIEPKKESSPIQCKPFLIIGSLCG